LPEWLGSTPSIAGGQNITIPVWTAIIGRHTKGGNLNAITLYALLYSQSTTTQLLQPGDVFICARIGDDGNNDKLLLGNGQVIGGNVQLKAGVLFDNGKLDKTGGTMTGGLTLDDGTTHNSTNFSVGGNIYVNTGSAGNPANQQVLIVENDDYSWRGKIRPTGASSNTAGVLAVAADGTTSITTIPTGTSQKTDLGSTAAGNSINAGTIGVTGTLPITSGGTGKTTRGDAATALLAGSTDYNGSANWNTYTKAGYYLIGVDGGFTTAHANNPGGYSYGFLIVVTSHADYTTQIYIPDNSQQHTIRYRTGWAGGNWRPWSNLAHPMGCKSVNITSNLTNVDVAGMSVILVSASGAYTFRLTGGVAGQTVFLVDQNCNPILCKYNSNVVISNMHNDSGAAFPWSGLYVVWTSATEYLARRSYVM